MSDPMRQRLRRWTANSKGCGSRNLFGSSVPVGLPSKWPDRKVALTVVPDLPHPLPNLRMRLQIGPVQLLEGRLVGRVPAGWTRRERLPSSAIQPFQRPDRRRLRLRLPPRLGVRPRKPLQLLERDRVDLALPVIGADSCIAFFKPIHLAVCGGSGHAFRPSPAPHDSGQQPHGVAGEARGRRLLHGWPRFG